ncbi:MAG TPA: hypothetical protein VNO26_14325 [Candidatus Limnocylindria bacterium]|nr:hypothetical protein [Candidatus Limnocylindria bacterium]
MHRLLVGEGHTVGATLVKACGAEWTRQRREVFVPLEYPPGDGGEVDFFEVYADVAGVRQKAFPFVVRLMYAGRDFAWLYPRQDQVCFLDGHGRPAAHFGALPRRLIYDNLKAFEGGGGADPGGLGARAHGPHAGPGHALRPRGVLRAAEDGAQ